MEETKVREREGKRKRNPDNREKEGQKILNR